MKPGDLVKIKPESEWKDRTWFLNPRLFLSHGFEDRVYEIKAVDNYTQIATLIHPHSFGNTLLYVGEFKFEILEVVDNAGE